MKRLTVLRANDGMVIPGRIVSKKCEDFCKSCGTPWSDHLGISGTCAKLEEARISLQVIRTWSKYPKNTTTNVRELSDILKLCEKTLEAIK